MPSLAAKKAKTCEMKYLSLSWKVMKYKDDKYEIQKIIGLLHL